MSLQTCFSMFVYIIKSGSSYSEHCFYYRKCCRLLLRKFGFKMCVLHRFFLAPSSKDHLKRNYVVFSFCLFCNSKNNMQRNFIPRSKSADWDRCLITDLSLLHLYFIITSFFKLAADVRVAIIRRYRLRWFCHLLRHRIFQFK